MSWIAQVRAHYGAAPPAAPADPFDPARATSGRGAGYADAALGDEVARVLAAVNGTRNHALNRAAFSLGQLVAGGALDRDVVVRELTNAGRAAGLTDAEVRATITSGLRSGAITPRGVPEPLWVPGGAQSHSPTQSHGTTETAPEQDEDNLLALLRKALVDTAGLDDIPDPDPLVGTDMVFRDTLNWVVGKPGCMKSLTMLDLAGCVASGEPWQGLPVHQGTVLYLVAEGVRGIKKRVRAWEDAMGHPMTGVQFLPVAVQSSHAGQWDALVELAAEVQPVMVVLDTQARITVGVEENSNTEMGQFVHQAERLRQACGAAVFIVHHIGRHGETGRGATTLDGAMSTIIRVTKEDDLVTLECLKNKDGAEWDPVALRAVPRGDSVVLSMVDTLSPAAGARGPSQAALRTARTWWECHRDKWAAANGLIDVVAPRSSFYRHREELEQAGLVVANRDQRYPTFRLTGPPPGVDPNPGGG